MVTQPRVAYSLNLHMKLIELWLSDLCRLGELRLLRSALKLWQWELLSSVFDNDYHSIYTFEKLN